jgi:hypothetical protein
MNIPEPRSYQRCEVKASRYLIGIGEPLYELADIQKVKDPLTRIFRRLCVENNITYPYFAQRFNEYSIDILQLPEVKVYNGLNNLKKPLYGKDGEKTQPLTSRTFLKFMAVLGFDVLNITIAVTTEEGQHQTYSLF